jgi:hypothetical protein
MWLSRLSLQRSTGVTLRDGARELAEPAWFGDLTGFFDSHDRTFYYFGLGFAFVILLHAERPFKGPASKRISRTGLVAGPVTAFARIEIKRTGRLELSLYEDPSQPDTGTKFRRDQEVVFTNHPQAGQMSGILEESSPELDLVR